MTLTKNVTFGAVWLVCAKLLTRFLDLFSMLILARLLLPADFGLVALASTVTTILNAVTDLSLANALIQMKDPQKSAFDTAFTLSLLRGVLLTVGLMTLAYPFSVYYGDQRLFHISIALGVTPFLVGLASPVMMQFQRELRYQPAFYLDVIAKISGVIVAVTTALLTQSYWAIVAGLVTSPFITMICSYLLAPYRPALRLTEWKEIFAFSSWLSLANLVNTLNWQSDRFFIGRMLGTSMLGQYTVGSELAALPTNAPLMPIMQSLYAGFARLAGDVDRLKGAYLTSQCVLIALALPIAISVSVLAKPIIIIAVGPTWLPAAHIVQILAPVFAIQMLTAPAHSVAMALGATRQIFGRDLLALFVRLPLILIALYSGGLEEVIWARVLSGLFIVLPNLAMMSRLLKVSIISQLFAPWRSYISGMALAGSLYVISHWTQVVDAKDLKTLSMIVVCEITSLAIYAAIHYFLWSLNKPPNAAEVKFLKFSVLRFPN